MSAVGTSMSTGEANDIHIAITMNAIRPHAVAGLHGLDNIVCKVYCVVCTYVQ